MRGFLFALLFVYVGIAAHADNGFPNIPNSNSNGGNGYNNPNGNNGGNGYNNPNGNNGGNGYNNPNGNNGGNGYNNPNGNNGGNGFGSTNGNNGGNGYNNPNGAANSNGLAHVVLKFNGIEGATSAIFTVQDKWQIFWFSPTPVNLTVLAPDGTIVTGASTNQRGSLYLGKGGAYYLQVENKFSPAMQWFFVVAEVAGGTQLSEEDGGAQLMGAPGMKYAPPAQVLPPSGNNSSFAQNGPAGSNNGNAPQNYPGQPNNFPGQNMGGQQQNAPAPTVKLSDDQARAVVLIKGDHAEGTGFLIKSPDGPVVVTNIHVLANNPNLKITTNTGSLITMVSYKAAADRDLAMIAIKDAGYSYLQTSMDISKDVQPGDEVVTPGNSQGGEVMLNTGGHVLGIGPERVEFDNPIYHGNSGGPVFHTKTNKVLGVVTEAMKVDTTNDLDKASFASRNSAISGSMRYFGLRLDTVTSWIAIDARSFQIETAFLDQVHEQSRRLDSLLNRADDNKPRYYGQPPPPEDESAKLYLKDDKIMKALHNFSDHAANADQAQMADARRSLLFDLQAVADSNVTQLQNPNNFYPFDRERAADELSYRKALKGELDNYGDNIDRMPRNY